MPLHRRKPASILLAVALCPAVAYGADIPAGGAGSFATLLWLGETIVPDARYEICTAGCDQTHRGILSWPVTPFFSTFDLGKGAAALINNPFFEPQLRVDNKIFRFALGDRLTYWFHKDTRAWVPWYKEIGLAIEGGAVFSERDGHGGFVGGGLSFGGLDQKWFLTSVTLEYRHVRTQKENRHDVTIDVTLISSLL